MDGGAVSGALVALAAVGVFFGRIVIYADRHDRARARRSQPPRRMVPRSPLLAEPRPRRSQPEPEDARPPLVEVPPRMLVRAAYIVAGERRADAGLLERRMPVIGPMAVKLMAALEGRGVIGAQDQDGNAPVLVTVCQLKDLIAQWGIVEDA